MCRYSHLTLEMSSACTKPLASLGRLSCAEEREKYQIQLAYMTLSRAESSGSAVHCSKARCSGEVPRPRTTLRPHVMPLIKL
jgi:hypothetical protein